MNDDLRHADARRINLDLRLLGHPVRQDEVRERLRVVGHGLDVEGGATRKRERFLVGGRILLGEFFLVPVQVRADAPAAPLELRVRDLGVIAHELLLGRVSGEVLVSERELVLLVLKPGDEDRRPALLVLGHVLVDREADGPLPELVELLADPAHAVRRALDYREGIERQGHGLHDGGQRLRCLLEVRELGEVDALRGVAARVSLDLDLKSGARVELDLVDALEPGLLLHRSDEEPVVIPAHPE